MSSKNGKDELSFFQRHFLLSAFVGTFTVAVIFLTGFFIWLGAANEAFAAVLMQCRSTVEAAKQNKQPVLPEERAGQAVGEALLSLNRFNGQLLECDRRLEQGITDWQLGSLTLEGLEMIAESNCTNLEKIKTKIKESKLPAELRAEERSRLNEAEDYLLRRLDKSVYRQENFSHLINELKSGKLKFYQGLYIEDTLKYMRIVKELEYEYKLVYGYGGYKKGLNIAEADDLSWVLLAQRGRVAEESGELERAGEIYTALTIKNDSNSRGAGYVLLAGLKKNQGDYAAYQELLKTAGQYWPGAAEESGEYGACRRQGLI